MRVLRADRAGGTSRRRAVRRRGMTSVLAMLYLMLFSAMALGFYAQTVMSSQVATSERKLHEAHLAAEAGLAFVKYHLSALDVPHLPTAQRMEEIYMQLAGRLDGTGNLAGGAVGYDSANLRIEIPEGPDAYVRTGADGTGFKAYVEINPDSSLKVKTIGRYGGAGLTGRGGVARGIEITFRTDERVAPLMQYGVATRGSVSVAGNGVVRGVPDRTYGSIFSTATTSPAVTMTGPSEVSGDIYLSSPTVTTSINASCEVGGVTGAAAASHVHKEVPAPEFPVIDTSAFRPYATGVYTVASGSVVRNCRVLANTNPIFGSGVTIEGVLYVETPNNVTFSGDCVIRGVIVSQTPYTGSPSTNSLRFGGKVTSYDASTLPASFGDVRAFTGSSVIAPGFHVQFGGGYAAMSGTIVGHQITFSGRAGGNIKGNIINLGPQPLTVTGTSDVFLEKPATNKWAAGVFFRSRYVARKETYVERRPEELIPRPEEGGVLEEVLNPIVGPLLR